MLFVGEQELDVAAGNATRATARRFTQASSTDYVEAPLYKARILAATDA